MHGQLDHMSVMTNSQLWLKVSFKLFQHQEQSLQESVSPIVSLDAVVKRKKIPAGDQTLAVPTCT